MTRPLPTAGLGAPSGASRMPRASRLRAPLRAPFGILARPVPRRRLQTAAALAALALCSLAPLAPRAAETATPAASAPSDPSAQAAQPVDPAEILGDIEIRRLPEGEALTRLSDLVALAGEADLVILGEIHDNPRHQAIQAALVRALGAQALALEMVPREAEIDLSRLRALRPDIDPDARQALEAASGWDGYAPYHLVLDAAPDAAVAGGGLSRARIRQAMQAGAAAAFEAEMRDLARQTSAAEGALPPSEADRYGLTAPLPEDQRLAMEADLRSAHCDLLPEEMIAPMVEAQRLRDASFAAALLRAHAALDPGEAGLAPGKRAAPSVLVTGDGHARRDRGTPAVLAQAAPALRVFSVAMAERPEGGERDWRLALAPWMGAGGQGGRAPFDAVIVTPRAAREDPCLSLRDRTGDPDPEPAD